MSRIYVAGASLEWKRAKDVMSALRSKGHTITQDWTVEVAHHEHVPPTGAQLEEYARLDMWGVQTADELVLLVPNGAQTTGAWAELGMALAHGIRIRASGPRAACVFLQLPCCETFGSDNELVRAL